jgi:hypothetical protein
MTYKLDEELRRVRRRFPIWDCAEGGKLCRSRAILLARVDLGFVWIA